MHSLQSLRTELIIFCGTDDGNSFDTNDDFGETGQSARDHKSQGIRSLQCACILTEQNKTELS